MNKKRFEKPQFEIIALSKLASNDGQIDGVPSNPRKFEKQKVEDLKRNIEQYPELLEYRSLMVYPIDAEQYVVIGGNMRLHVLRDELHYDDAPCVVLPKETTAEKLRAYAILDNNNFGDWDWDMLSESWDMEELSSWGLDTQKETEEPTAEEDEFSDEEADNVEHRCKLGDIWQLGRHRLICGDSTKAETYELLMNGERAEISFTSPPYNAGTTPTEVKMKKTAKYANDDDNKSEQDYLHFLVNFTRNAMRHSQYCFVNIQSLSNNKTALIEYLHELIDVYADTIIWDKMHSQPAMAENVLNSEFEYVHIFSEKAMRTVGTKKFRGTISNILHLSKQNNNEFSKIHNATFSVEFASHFINNFCNESVLDAFGGSGTTLIAAEQLGRKCFMIELDPHYCNVIIARWEQLTQETAVKVN
jgi:DNA modification methylase